MGQKSTNKDVLALEISPTLAVSLPLMLKQLHTDVYEGAYISTPELHTPPTISPRAGQSHTMASSHD
jgi:hypothetical protein